MYGQSNSSALNADKKQNKSGVQVGLAWFIFKKVPWQSEEEGRRKNYMWIEL